MTPLLLAAQDGHLDIVKFLLEKGVALDTINKVSTVDGGDTLLPFSSLNNIETFLLFCLYSIQTESIPFFLQSFKDEREGQGERDRQIDRQTDKQTDRQTDRGETQGETDIQREKGREIERERERERERESERKTIEQYQQIIVISLNPRKRGNKLTTNN